MDSSDRKHVHAFAREMLYDPGASASQVAVIIRTLRSINGSAVLIDQLEKKLTRVQQKEVETALKREKRLVLIAQGAGEGTHIFYQTAEGEQKKATIQFISAARLTAKRDHKPFTLFEPDPLGVEIIPSKTEEDQNG